ncbi:hypothetical protein ABW20_dc0110396 [Dactylellina cionopaga]|nr:hypothetical protein ABW20_dc0110396 [Dactylellina cionopaga]
MTSEGRTYADAIVVLNGFQSNFATLDAARKAPTSGEKNFLNTIKWFGRAGYQGKGSTCAFITSILRQYSSPTSPSSGFPKKIGTYTSPHLKAVRERIQINGEPLSEPLFAKYFFELIDRLHESGGKRNNNNASSSSGDGKEPILDDGDRLNYFRFLTLLAFHVYVREGTDTVVLEVGIGGEYDSTNLVEKPTVTGITSLGIDHVGVLGNTIAEIAWFKAGILKNGTKGFTVLQEEEGMEVIKKRAVEKSVELEVAGLLKGVEGVKLGLAGEFQKGNASLAVKMVEEHMKRCGVDIDVGDGEVLPEEVKKGLETAVWKGRCQIIDEEEGAGIQWCIDGAHTKESVLEAGKWFASVNKKGGFKNIVLLFNQQTRDAQQLARDLNKILKEQLGGDIFTQVYFTTNRTYSDHTYKPDLISINVNSEAVDALRVQKGLAKAWEETGSNADVHVMETIQETVEAIRQLEGRSQVLVTGSLHLVGGFLEVVEGDDKPAAISSS